MSTTTFNIGVLGAGQIAQAAHFPAVRKAKTAQLYAICDADVCAGAGWSLLDLASACLDGGAVVLQVRAKQAAAGWLLGPFQRAIDFRTSVVDAAQALPCSQVHLILERAYLCSGPGQQQCVLHTAARQDQTGRG